MSVLENQFVKIQSMMFVQAMANVLIEINVTMVQSVNLHVQLQRSQVQDTQLMQQKFKFYSTLK